MGENSHNLYNPEIYEKPCCTLQAYGDDFDPDAFLTKSHFSQPEILFKGTIGLPDEARRRIEKAELPYSNAFDIFDTPFLLLLVSRAPDFSSQIDEATLFLKRYSDNLKILREFPNIEIMLMRFIVKDETATNFQDFPSEFSDLVSIIGIDSILFG